MLGGSRTLDPELGTPDPESKRHEPTSETRGLVPASTRAWPTPGISLGESGGAEGTLVSWLTGAPGKPSLTALEAGRNVRQVPVCGCGRNAQSWHAMLFPSDLPSPPHVPSPLARRTVWAWAADPKHRPSLGFHLVPCR